MENVDHPDQDHPNKIVPDDHPERCQAINKAGEQCRYLAIPGQQFCKKHMSNPKAVENRIYNLTKWRARVGEHAKNANIYSLREDLGVLRILLETQLNKCNDDDDLIARSPAIADLVIKIDGLVGRSAKLEERLRLLLDINAVSNFADAVIDAVIQEIDTLKLEPEQRDDILDRLAEKIETAMPKFGEEDANS